MGAGLIAEGGEVAVGGELPRAVDAVGEVDEAGLGGGVGEDAGVAENHGRAVDVDAGAGVAAGDHAAAFGDELPLGAEALEDADLAHGAVVRGADDEVGVADGDGGAEVDVRADAGVDDLADLAPGADDALEDVDGADVGAVDVVLERSADIHGVPAQGDGRAGAVADGLVAAAEVVAGALGERGRGPARRARSAVHVCVRIRSTWFLLPLRCGARDSRARQEAELNNRCGAW